MLIKALALCGMVLALTGGVAFAQTDVRLTNEGSATLGVTDGSTSTTLNPSDSLDAAVSSSVSLTVTAGSSSSSLRTRNFGPNSIRIFFGAVTFVVAPGFALVGNVPANGSVVISEIP